MVRGRPYRDAVSHEAAVEELHRCAGSQFDPGLVPLFIDEAERVESGVPPATELPAAALLGRNVAIAPGAVPVA
jgi:HD-GYP domain-containing protein (c-di-GMP phosphodiesterase class II)